MKGSGRLVGTGHLLVLGLRRDRGLTSAWALVLAAVCYASAAATDSLYPTVAARVAAAEAIGASPALVALYGPIHEPHSLGELAMTKTTVLYAVFVALLLLLIVRRHTRAEEESGRAELLGGTAVGLAAPLAAAVGEGVLIAVGVGLLAALATVAGGLPVAGSLAFGASWAGTGLVSVGVTAVACQLSASSRTCAAIAAATLGVQFVVRAVGDLAVPWVGWLSPLGWGSRLHAWSAPRWWVLLLYAGSAVLLVVAAQVLRSRRDLGSGLLAGRPGPSTAPGWLSGPLALELRLNRALLTTWTVAVAVLGVLMGSVSTDLGPMLDSRAARDVMVRLGGPGAVSDTLLAAVLSISALVVTCLALTVVGHRSADERAGLTEQVLATASSRRRSFGALAAVVLLGVSWLLLVTGAGLTVGFAAAGGALASGRLLAAALAQAPAVWLVSAIAVAAYSWSNRWTPAGWGVLALFVSLGQLGELLRLPWWLVDLSPFAHAPRMPATDFELGPALTMTATAWAILALAWVRYRGRDIG